MVVPGTQLFLVLGVEKLRESLDEATESRLLADEVRMIPLKISSFTGVELTATAQRASEESKPLDAIKPWWKAQSNSKARACLYTRSDSVSCGPRRKKSKAESN
jgi:hypothetical protein